MSLTDFPCGECGAQGGQECSPDCPVANMSVEEWGAQCDEFDVATGALLTGTPPREDSEVRLMAAVHRLPFNGLVGTRGTGAPDRGDFTDGDEWLAALADWMTEYEQMLRVQVEELEAQSRRLISRQIESDVIDGVIRRALGRIE